MKIDENGRIAYHSLRLREDGGIDFVQYDFDGSIEEVRTYKHPPIITNGPY